MTSLLLPLLAATTGLTLHLAPTQNDVVVGEPLRLALTWRAQRTLQLPSEVANDGWDYDYAQIWVDGPTGRHQYREIPPVLEDPVTLMTPLTPGAEYVSELLLLFGYRMDAPQSHEFLLSMPGTYTVTIRYADEKNPAESNAITVRVKPPEAADRTVFETLKSDPFEMKLGGPKTDALLEKHPGSPYLRVARVARYREKEHRLLERQDPETGDPLSLSDDQRAPFAASFYRAMADDVEASGNWGPYEDVRLGMLAGYAKRGGDSQLAERTRKELLTRFPKSRAADGIRNEEAREKPTVDDEPADWSGHGVSYEIGSLVNFDGWDWKCIQAHRSQSTWSPSAVPSLWVKVPPTLAP